MADTFAHGALKGWGAKGTLLLAGTPLAENPECLLAVVLGATIPDIITEPLIWAARHRHFGKRRSWLVSLRYDALLTLELRELERRRTWQIQWYWCWHSVWTAMLIALVLHTLAPLSHLGYAWAFGHLLHIVLDVPMHTTARPFWPLPKIVSLVRTNWWEWEIRIPFYKRVISLSFKWVYIFSVPAALGGIYHLFQLFGLAP